MEIELEDYKMYWPKDLRRYLEAKGLVHSRPTLKAYEDQGLIPKSKSPINGWRFYTGLEIKQIADIIRKKTKPNG